jgi:hypothetical protein
MAITRFAEFNAEMGGTITAYAAADVATDVFVAGAMCWLLAATRPEDARSGVCTGTARSASLMC